MRKSLIERMSPRATMPSPPPDQSTPFNIHDEGDRVRLQVEFMYRHRASGEPLSGIFRLVLQFRDGEIIRGDEYHDRARIEAFMRLIASEA